MRTRNRRHVLTRVAAMLTALVAGSIVVVAVATPAPADTVCNTNAHVYLINLYNPGTFTRWETDPIDGPTYDLSFPADTDFVFQIGGNGLNPLTAPYWDVFDQNGVYLKRVVGNRADANCVSNQTSFIDSGTFDTAHLYRAVYVPGNNIVIPYRQAHFRLIFDQPPLLPPDPAEPTPTDQTAPPEDCQPDLPCPR